MKDTLTFANHADFQRRYAKTYGWLLTEEANRKFVYVSDVDQDFVYFNEGGTNDFHVKANSEIFFEFIPVNRGWFTARDGNVYYLQRVPARQWQRGICAANTQIWMMTKAGPVNIGLNYQRLESIFNNVDLHKIKNIKNGPFTLSKQFAVSPNGQLFWYLQEIGSYAFPVIKNKIPEIQQELMDIIRRRDLGITSEIINA